MLAIPMDERTGDEFGQTTASGSHAACPACDLESAQSVLQCSHSAYYMKAESCSLEHFRQLQATNQVIFASLSATPR